MGVEIASASRRDEERRREIQEFVSVCSSLLALPLFLVFWICDAVYAPLLRWQFLALRLTIVPVALVTTKLVKRARTLRQAETVGLLFTAYNGWLITTMIVWMNDPRSPYYAGLNLVAFGTLTFVPWSRPYLVATVVGVYGPFLAFLARDAVRSGSVSAASVALVFFVVATVVISLVVRHFTEGLRRRELATRVQLEEELTSRERIIREKTTEAVRLQSLAKQFSPQVVHSITSGKLDLVDSLHLADICAIFVDIADSTDHVRQMPLESVNEVIAMFMEDTMRVLLKYDITIDKFLGDGVLAFSNDPIERGDYVERVVDAALEIRARIHNRQSEYRTIWGDDFHVRIGIARGPASVGFYGSEDYIKAYTAIGKVVNLACRLASVGRIDQVSVTADIAAVLLEKAYTVQELGPRALKGFEDGTVVHEVVDGRRATKLADDLADCPRGHGVLYLETNDEGIYVFACRKCGYTLDKPSSMQLRARLRPVG
jgi:class 3 adenylate cyclase